MALPAGRVGVKADQVDWQGKIIGGGSGGELTPRVEHLEGQIGTFEFLVQNGVAGYKKAGADTFHPFRGFTSSEVAVNTTSSEVLRVNFSPSWVIMISNRIGSSGVEVNYWKFYGESRGARGTTTSSGGTNENYITVVEEDGEYVIKAKCTSQGFVGTYDIFVLPEF